MHPKTLFRILLKFAGVCLFIFGLLSLIPESAALLTDSDTGPVRMPLGYHVRMWTRITLEIAAGLYLFFRAGWIVDAAFSTPHPCCPHCAYRLQSGQAKCPECGADLPSNASGDQHTGDSPDAT